MGDYKPTLFVDPAAKEPERKKQLAPADVTTREISKLFTFYNKNVRQHSKDEMLGLFRNEQRMLKRGKVTMMDMSQAVQNYAKDDWVKRCDQRRRCHIRTFFTEEKILQWREPVKSTKPADPTLAALDRLAEIAAQPVPAPPEPINDVVYDDDEPTMDEL